MHERLKATKVNLKKELVFLFKKLDKCLARVRKDKTQIKLESEVETPGCGGACL